MWKLFTDKCSIQISKDNYNILRNKDIILIKQNKGGGVVFLDRKHYIEKCLNILEFCQFKKLEKDPTKMVKNKMQRKWVKINQLVIEHIFAHSGKKYIIH